MRPCHRDISVRGWPGHWDGAMRPVWPDSCIGHMIEREPKFSWEDGVGTIRRTAVVWVALALAAAGAEAQEPDAG